MKTLIFIISIFVFVFSVSAQNNCPNISVSGPSGIVALGQNVAFTARVEGIDLSKIEYKWSVSVGKIISGQNTSTLIASRNNDEAGQVITATVEIGELPQNCPKTASATEEICQCFTPYSSRLIDEFSENSPHIKIENLEKIKIELGNGDSSTKAYIVEKFKRGTSSKFIRQRIENIYRYFYENTLISSKSINVQIFFAEKNSTQIWIISELTEAPNKEIEKIEISGEDYRKNLDKLFPVKKNKHQKKILK